ncbi:serine hydrolase domain-containing protein [Jidongwangia harbinensis]|uniref:serine hydrolase domain-containing protein n=1 Tax=Jidongwangia harbinensis TaxID=2878561 RepID=UPI001CDA445F|nr:serine hydrolase domain-containing protein [Jidongwangia harbinensis]MCA2214702.1 beta-lactamase family protein [Jidongwangia harbinensis]
MLRRALTCVSTAVLLVAPAGTATAAPPGDVLQRRLDAVHAAGMPGAFAEVRDGDRTRTPATGVIDIRTGRPVRDGLRHRVGSITKTLVATTVLQLAGEKRLRLDAPIGRYLPDLVPGEMGRRVTVRMLLNHTSGIGDFDTELIREPEDLITVGRTTYRPEHLVRIGLAAPPTTGYAYANTNYVLAGLIVERATGRSLESEVTRRILRPLHLRDTYFEGADPLIRGPHMHAYVPWTDGEPRDFTRYNMSWLWAAGDLVSTAADLNRFYRALLTGRLLTPPLLAEMQTTPGSGYGLGLYAVQLPCGTFWGHDGGTIGHQTVSWHSPDGTRQVTYAQSMAFYQESPTEPHPIDVAAGVFLVTALCGGQPAARSAAAVRPATDGVLTGHR